MDFNDAYPKGCTTEAHVTKFVFTWTLKRFRSLADGVKVGDFVESIPFSSASNDPKSWYMILYPSSDREDSKGHIALYLFLKTSDKPKVKARARFWIVNARKQSCYDATTSVNHFSGGGSGYGFSKFIDLKVLLSQSSSLLVDDTLTIKTEVEIISDPVTRNNYTDPPIRVIESNMNEDFYSLLQSKAHTDVKLLVDKNEIEAHKVFLMARSSVFRAMFEVEMKEKHENRVEITDTEPPVINAMLRFIYTDEKPDFEKVPADKLLPIADKYDLPRLKTMCEADLCARLSVDNVSQILVLADRHSCQQLKHRTLEFVKTNIAQLAIREDCKEALCKNQHLLSDILFALI